MASPLRLRGSLAKGPLGTLGAPKGILLDTRQLMVTSSTNDRVNIEQDGMAELCNISLKSKVWNEPNGKG